MTPKVTLLAALVLAFAAGAVLADTLYLKNGKSYEGKLISDSGGKVKFKTTTGVVLDLPKSQVDRVEKGLTKVDEYADRLKGLPPDDMDGHLELARWCHEEKLFAQKKKVLKLILKKCPDHPETRREKRQVWVGGKWIRAKKDMEEIRVEGGDKVELTEARAAVVLPKGWSVRKDAKSVTATGPDRYKVPPILTLEFGGDVGDPGSAFPEKEGWGKPEEVAASGLSGLMSRRGFTEDLVARVEGVAVLRGRANGLRARLTCLKIDMETFEPALKLALKTLAVKAPPADYTNKHYGYELKLPKDSKWKHGEDKNHDLHLNRQGDMVEDWANMVILTGKTDSEKKEVQEIFDAQVAGMKSAGDITRDEDYTLSGEKGRIVDGTSLASGGYPIRIRVIHVTHKGRVYYIRFSQHEFGQDRSNACWDTVIGSFRFLDWIELRPYSGTGDLDLIVEVLAAADAVEGLGRAFSRAELEEEWADRDATRDVFLAMAPDGGAAVGFVALAHYPGREEDTFVVEGAVHPDHRRQGVGTALLARAREEVARRAANLEIGHSVYFRAYTREQEAGRIALFTKLGLEPFFEVKNLARTLEDLPPPEPAPGLLIRGFQRGEDDVAARVALSEAFEEDPQAVPVTDERWRQLMQHADPELWVLAFEGEECAGICHSEIGEERNRRLGIREGCVDEVGVRPAWRGRGLGKALLLAAMHRLREAGMDTAHLFVVSGNPTGAERLYERAGFALRWRTLHYRERIHG